MPTRTEQSDLQFVLHVLPRRVPAGHSGPGTIEECFYAGFRAFNIAEKTQGPVFILTDMNQSTAIRAVDPGRFDFDAIPIDRGELLTNEDLDALTEPYLRHKVTESGISPRAVPGHPNAIVFTTSDEHYENGQAVEAAEPRIEQMEKRMRKPDLADARDTRSPGRGAGRRGYDVRGCGQRYGPHPRGPACCSRATA